MLAGPFVGEARVLAAAAAESRVVEASGLVAELGAEVAAMLVDSAAVDDVELPSSVRVVK